MEKQKPGSIWESLGFRNTPLFMVIKSIVALAAIGFAVYLFIESEMLNGLVFLSAGIMLLNEVYIVKVKRRAVKSRDQIYYALIILICLVVKFTTKY